jgi:hypothetical protein
MPDHSGWSAGNCIVQLPHRKLQNQLLHLSYSNNNSQAEQQQAGVLQVVYGGGGGNKWMFPR